MTIEWIDEEPYIDYTKRDRKWLKEYINKVYPEFWKNEEITEIDINFDKKFNVTFDNKKIHYIDVVGRETILDILAYK